MEPLTSKQACEHFQCVGPGSYLPVQSAHTQWQNCPWCEIARLKRELAWAMGAAGTGVERHADEPTVSDTVERALRSIAGGIMSGQEAAHIANNALRELITRRLAEPPTSVPGSDEPSTDDLITRLRWKWADHGAGYNSEYTADLMAAADRLAHLHHRVYELERDAEPPKAKPWTGKRVYIIPVEEQDCTEEVTENLLRGYKFKFWVDGPAVTKSAKCALKGCDNDAPLGGVCAAHETSAAQPWKCTICNTLNPDDVTHCRQCEYSRMITRGGQRVPRDGRL